MDFYTIAEASKTRNSLLEIKPDFRVNHSKDLMVRGKAFYAIWDESSGFWSTDEYDVARLVDEDLRKYGDERRKTFDGGIDIKFMTNFRNNVWSEFKKYTREIADNSHQLDAKLIFSNMEVKKNDYASKRLPYPLEEGKYDSYEEIISTLYDPEERAKIEWAIGAVISGDAKNIQKFLVFYGDPGTGKSTILDIIQELFNGYYVVFDAKALTTNGNTFSTEVFKSNPLVAIQHDGDLSKIEDNTKLNSIVSHEEILVREMYKSAYPMRSNCFLFMASNKPVKITDAKAGLIRRLIDVRPSGRKIETHRYFELKEKVQFELGAIAYHCLEVYKSMGKSYYTGYRPVDMMYKTDPFFNFVEDSYDVFSSMPGVTLKQAYAMYKAYCTEANASYVLQMYNFREELKNYFKSYEDEARVDNKHVRNYYSGFLSKKFERTEIKEAPKNKASESWLNFDKTTSLFDIVMKNCVAQYGKLDDNERPYRKWENVTTKLSDLDTCKLHYVKVPENLIVIDFDIKGDDGSKSFEKNLEAASKWPKTYAELSKSGKGIHLHYLYSGDVKDLSCVYDDNIEVKVFTGNASLRRKLTKCNDIPVSTISSGLPLKEMKGDMVNFEAVKNEKAIRTLVRKNLAKEYHAGTKPSIDFIEKILNDAYNGGVKYDITDMRPAILNFAANSSHQSEYCIKMVNQMKFKSEDPSDNIDIEDDQPIVFFDVEVFPNLFLLNWKYAGDDHKVVRCINPTPNDIEEFLKMKLVGFNNRRYDNHILYARMMGYTNEQLFNLSSRIVNGSENCMFSEAYNISYTDIYDFSSKKQSLKKFEIELGVHHQELGLPWDQPVPEELWVKVAEYCDNDVLATEAVWNARQEDFLARQILADIAGGTVNDTTNSLTGKLIFGTDRKPQSQFRYRNLAEPVTKLDPEMEEFLKEKFPEMMSEKFGDSVLPFFDGYSFDNGISTYKNEKVGEGGLVRAKPGMYGYTKVFDVASMHPHSACAEYHFGKYTKNFSDLMDARVYIKHKEFDKAGKLFGGKLKKYLNDVNIAKKLAGALKIAINAVYGLTSAGFANLFKDPRNIDNIVAKRGALFMMELKEKVEAMGATVVHIKTDSIKIENPSKEVEDFVYSFGKRHGYTFEIEHIFEKICLVNDAVYIAKCASDDPETPGAWEATGTQFAVPYVYKTLFSKEPIEFSDLCETKTVTGSLYLDMNEGLNCDEHNYRFVGKAGLFCPIKEGCGGGELLREKDGKYSAATGTKGYRWLESETVDILDKKDCIDLDYYRSLVDKAKDTINEYGDFEQFAS